MELLYKASHQFKSLGTLTSFSAVTLMAIKLIWILLNKLSQKNDRGLQKRQDTENTVVRERTNVTEPIIKEIRRRRLSLFGHISRMEIDRLPARALYCHVTGECSQGRQAKKWIENIKEDFLLWNIQFKDAVANCKDRTAWRQLISSTSSSPWWRRRKKKERRKEINIWVGGRKGIMIKTVKVLSNSNVTTHKFCMIQPNLAKIWKKQLN